MPKISSISSACMLTLAVAASLSAAQAQTEDEKALQLRSLAATCAQCHGTDGRAVPGSIVPALAGAPEANLIEQMAAFRAGSRPATVMTQIARGFSDAQVRQLAAYFAAQAR